MPIRLNLPKDISIETDNKQVPYIQVSESRYDTLSISFSILPTYGKESKYPAPFLMFQQKNKGPDFVLLFSQWSDALQFDSAVAKVCKYYDVIHDFQHESLGVESPDWYAQQKARAKADSQRLEHMSETREALHTLVMDMERYGENAYSYQTVRERLTSILDSFNKIGDK